MTTAIASDEGTRLSVTFGDGTHATYDRWFLRDSCTCPACLHPSGQRLVSVAQLRDEPRLAGVHADGAAIDVEFAPDGHHATFDEAWLREQAAPRPPSLRRVETWDASLAVPDATHAAVTTSRGALRDWLGAADRFGLALLHGVPATDGAVASVAELFGHVRSTNYGRVFDVRSVVDPANLADTALALGPHTDNPYRVPVPTLQLLHCLRASLDGGESTFVDGLAVAAALREEDERAFQLLSSVPVRFRYRSTRALLEAEAPVLERDARGEVAAIRFNTRSAQPPVLDAETAAAWYAAYRRFAALAEDERLVVRLALGPGDLALFDNRRVLHGRTAFTGGGERLLQGCYAEADGLRSTLALLSEER